MTATKLKALTEVKRLWILMCKADDIEPDAKFVVFSNDNPYQAEYDAALKKYWEA